MRVAVIVQRYGNEVVGGAESHSRKIAERLHSEMGWDVEVLTTTSQDYRTWANHYPKGLDNVNGLVVRRFPVLIKRAFFFGVFHRFVCHYLPSLERRWWLRWAVRPVEKLWYIFQGPYCPDLIRYLRKHGREYDALFFFTYLYYPTVEGIGLHSERSFLIPTAHDEPPFYFHGTLDALKSARRILANTPAEVRLIIRRLREAEEKTVATGLGIDMSEPQASPEFARRIQSYVPYLLYLGRVDHGKLIHVLIDNFLSYLEAHPENKAHLVLAGGKDAHFPIPDHPRVHYLGFVSEGEKAHLIKNSLCMINPSAFESMSMIVAEAMTSCKPVIVNGHCEVLRDYQALSSTVFPYYDKEDFMKNLTHVLDTPWTESGKQALLKGKEAIDTMFSWRKVMDNYRNAVVQIEQK